MTPDEAQAPLCALPPGARIHLIGVAGSGMNALAAVLLARGYRLSGSDMQRTTQVDRLIAQGMAFRQGHDAAAVRATDLVIISAAVREENAELSAARSAGIPVAKRAAALGWLLDDRRTIAVAGTHGKTTTTAMLAVILHRAGFDPTYAVGGEVLDLGNSAHWGTGAWAVVEADEYDRSFLQLRPEIAVITNVEPDHLEYYGSVGAMHEAYAQFVARIRPGGTLVINADDPYLGRMGCPPDVRMLRCGRHQGEAAWRLSEVEQSRDGIRFRAIGDPGGVDLKMPLAGLHNAYNALEALAAASLAGVPLDAVGAALRTFHGTGRRFQVVGTARDVLVIDDYAHHPTEIRATLAAARARYSGQRLVAVFQPHTYSRTALLFDQFIGAFDDADLLLLTEIYAARETDTLGIDSERLRRAIAGRAGGPSVHLVPGLADVPAALLPVLRPGDVVLTLGAGTVTQVGPLLLDALLHAGQDHG